MKSEICKTCQGTGKIRDITTYDKGLAGTTCIQCGGRGYKQVPDAGDDEVDPDDPRAMKDDEYESERLGTVIFLIGAGLLGLKLGVDLFHLAPAMTSLPPWYYAVVIAVVGALAYFFRSIVAMLSWLAVFGAILYWGGGFVLKTFF